jgi:hypothetical protein
VCAAGYCHRDAHAHLYAAIAFSADRNWGAYRDAY